MAVGANVLLQFPAEGLFGWIPLYVVDNEKIQIAIVRDEKTQKTVGLVTLEDLIEEIVGDAKGVTGAVVKNLKTGDSKKVEARGVFVAIGHLPTTELFKDTLKLQPNGYLWVQPGTAKTSIEGVFASGDVSDATYRQAVTAAGTGCMAAIEAERWMTEHGI